MRCSIMLATLMDVLGLAAEGSWSTPGGEEARGGGGKGTELPSATDEEEFQMLMMQVGDRIDCILKSKPKMCSCSDAAGRAWSRHDVERKL